MTTLRVDICYRPLRIGWAIKSDDYNSFRKAVRYSHALWGGRFNPILFVDHEAESSRLVDLFRVDVIIAVGDIDAGKNFLKKYPYLIKPFFHESVFMKGGDYSNPSSNVLDIHNALAYLHDKQEWNELIEYGIQVHTWADNDPLADVFVSQLGGYPSVDDVGKDYLKTLKHHAEISEILLDSEKPIPLTTFDRPGISYLSSHGIERHYGITPGWDTPGFFVGSAGNLEDLVCHWNLRACDIPLLFIDPEHMARYTDILPDWEKKMRAKMANYRQEYDKSIAVWTRFEDLGVATRPLGDRKLLRYQISETSWNGLNIRAPIMCFGEASVLGAISNEGSKPKISFALPDKPFCADKWFHRQSLVASISLIGGLYEDEQHTFQAPYLPELNEFYARTMHFEYNKLRIEPDSIGIIIGADDHDSYLYALPVSKLFERLFDMAGYDAKLSNAGLITKQLITRLGGVQGGRVFKVPGVRQLLKTRGPNASITKRTALQAIGSGDPDRPTAKFQEHENLFIERRPRGEKLTPNAIFGYLVEKGLFRVGIDLDCPSCKMSSWIPLDSLKHKVSCSLCEHEHDVARSLTDLNEWHYRRSGVLGIEKNLQGAVPVLLTLQQLDTNFTYGYGNHIYSASLDLTPNTVEGGKKCETDFAWVIPREYPRKTVVILAECKDKGPISVDDVRNLKRVADSLPRRRFKTFIILSQISPFTKDEIEFAKELNATCRRAILLSANELEPYYIRERTRNNSTGLTWDCPEAMAESTHQLYFSSDASV